MGSQSSKSKEQGRFSPNEFKAIEASYKTACGHSDKLNRERFLSNWTAVLDQHLAECTADFLFRTGHRRIAYITVLEFGEPLLITDRGTLEERVDFIIASLDKVNTKRFVLKELENYVTSVFRTFINIQLLHPQAEIHNWKRHGYLISERTILAFSKGLIRSLVQNMDNIVTKEKLEQWLETSSIFLAIWAQVFSFLYSKNCFRMLRSQNFISSHTNLVSGSDMAISSTRVQQHHFLPAIEGLANVKFYVPILDIPHVIFINSHLPIQSRHKWRFLFSSKTNGESFSTMVDCIINQGPTIVIVEDEDRFTYAGFAPHSWNLRPKFFGDDSALLFALSPAMRCFTASGFNDHYQYLNMNQQSLPNGLGMGGHYYFYGLWIDRDFGRGQSNESCATFLDYKQLSKRKEFRIHKLEVWAIGDKPDLSEENSEKLTANHKMGVAST